MCDFATVSSLVVFLEMIQAEDCHLKVLIYCDNLILIQLSHLISIIQNTFDFSSPASCDRLSYSQTHSFNSILYLSLLFDPDTHQNGIGHPWILGSFLMPPPIWVQIHSAALS